MAQNGLKPIQIFEQCEALYRRESAINDEYMRCERGPTRPACAPCNSPNTNYNPRILWPLTPKIDRVTWAFLKLDMRYRA